MLAGLEPAKFNSAAEAISRLAVKYPVALGGAGAGSELAARLGAEVLPPDPVGAAAQVAARTPVA